MASDATFKLKRWGKGYSISRTSWNHRNKTHIILTLASTDGDTGNVFKDLLASSSDEQSEHKKCSNFFASSMVIPIQEGWNLQKMHTKKEACLLLPLIQSLIVSFKRNHQQIIMLPRQRHCHSKKKTPLHRLWTLMGLSKRNYSTIFKSFNSNQPLFCSQFGPSDPKLIK